MKTLQVETKETSYPLVIGEGVIHQLPAYIPNSVSKILIVTDEQVGRFHLSKVKEGMQSLGLPVEAFILPQGETAKSFAWLEKIMTKAIELGLDRRSLMIALGGGVVGDVAGFAASIYMRGIPYIQIPTTILAHDSSIGGKVAINHPLGKNMIGAFYHPLAVIYDTASLLTLPERDYISGFAEVIKHAIIKDKDLLDWLEANSSLLLNRDLVALETMLYRSMKIKADIVRADEREQNIRALLNYGHTTGHAFEIASDYSLLHGEAVAIGMVVAARIAQKYFHHEVDVVRIERLIQAFSLPIRLEPVYQTEEILPIMMRDKKFKHGRIVMVLPESLGKAYVTDRVEKDWIIETLQEVKKG